MKYPLPENSTVLITGATGFTGRWLVDKLLNEKVAIKVIARPSRRADELKSLGCEVIEGQIYDPATVAAACRGIDYIIHIAAAFREAGVSDDIYGKVHVDATKLLAEAAAKLPGFKRFVHVSTMGVHGHIENPPANEESPYGPGDLYQETKLEAELWLRDFAKERTGCRWPSSARPASTGRATAGCSRSSKWPSGRFSRSSASASASTT